MSVRDHMSQHEVAERLPLVTESATVTDITALDHNRRAAVTDAAATLLREHDHEEWVTDHDDHVDIDWEELVEYLDGHEHDREHLTERIHTLHDRATRPYPALLSIRLHEEERTLEYTPGQYVTVTFHDTPRPYSIANSPTEDGVETCLRRVPGGRLTSDIFEELEEGDEVTIRGPTGEFVLQEPSSRDMAFIATGTGVAPLKAMIDYTFEEDRDRYDDDQRDVWLILGSSWEDDLPYRDAFERYADERENFHYVPTLSREEYLTDWDGETAYVQHVFAKYLDRDAVDPTSVGDAAREYLDENPAYDIDARMDPDSLEVYACGVNAMVYPLVDTVGDAGVPEKHIESEGYG